jgi:hypothetical protein
MVSFVIGLIVFVIVFLAIYKQASQTAPPPAAETVKKEEPKSPTVEVPAKSEESIDPFKSAVPPKD